MKCNTLLVALCALFLVTNTPHTNATVIAQGDGTAAGNSLTFSSAVIAKVYDDPSSYFIVSTASPSGTPGATFSYFIAKANRTFGVATPTFQPIAPSQVASNVPMLALATSRRNPNPNIAFVQSGSATQVNIMTDTGYLPNSTTPGIGTSAALNDASGAVNQPGATTGAVTNIAANQSFIFAAVAPNGATTFGATNSGIAVVSINQNTLALTQVAANSGDSGVKAAAFNPTIPAVLIEGVVNINPNAIATPYPQMVWDNQLQRLYIGYDLETNDTTTNNSGGRSVAVAYTTNAAGTLAFSPIAPNSAFNVNQQNNIIGVILSEACEPYCYPADCYPPDCYTDQEPFCYPVGCHQEPYCVYPACPEADLSVHKIAVLHASTGPSYLIVNGNNGIRSTTGNMIFALPLVDNPSTPTTHGTLANKNSALTNGKFTVPAINNPDLITNTDAAGLVGAGPFPFDADNQLSDLVVIGDTVYASSNIPQSTTNEVGIFYSQAMFDQTGKIIRWTPWTKRSFPYTGFPNNSPQVSFFDVDAATGEIWAVDGVTKTIVAITEWDKGTSPVSLVAQLNKNLSGNNGGNSCPKGCYSVLDLDQSTRGFLGNTCSRYALFGGPNMVIFAQVSQAYGLYGYCNAITNPQMVTTDYSQPENLLATSLPECGAVTVLEYARRDSSSPNPYLNYFYAGTQNGLYVFAGQQGAALDVRTFGDLNEPPFSTGMWQLAPNIPGAVVDIKTTGNVLYVLTVSSASAPLQGTLYSIPFQSTINAMFAPSNISILAQTNTAPTFFYTIVRFLGMQIISTNSTGSTEQLVLATNRGLFQSSCPGGVQQVGITQISANWLPISDSGTNLYLGIGGMHTSIPIAPPSTVWPFNLQDPHGLKLFNRGSINQLSGTADAGPFDFVPSFFNSIDTTNPNFATFYPITYFWSDGARRFFIINPVNQECACPTHNRLMVLPFDTVDWNIAKPQQDISFDPTLKSVQSFNWVQDIGATGITMAGTNKGVVGLE